MGHLLAFRSVFPTALGGVLLLALSLGGCSTLGWPDRTSQSDTEGDANGSNGDTLGLSPAAELTCGASTPGDTRAPEATQVIDSYPCSNWDATGPEMTFSFRPETDTDVTASLSDISADQDLDIYLLEDRGNGPDAEACLLFGNDLASWEATAGQTYYVVVDGFLGTEGSFSLDLDCKEPGDSPADPPQPGDDDDSNGDDDDVTDGTCSANSVAECGQSLTADTTGHLATSDMDGYTCSGWDASGPEVVFSFHPSEECEATATLSFIAAGQDLDVYVLEDVGSGCTSDQCISYGNTSASWETAAGQSYYIVVDGYLGDAGGFTLDLSCTSSDPEPDPDPDPNPEPGADGTTSCGTSTTGDTNDGSNDADSYSCSIWDASGPELVFAFAATTTGDVTAALSAFQEGEDLDLYILDDDGNGVDPNACISYGNLATTFAATAGQDYYIVVDGYYGDAGTFSLDVTCAESSTPAIYDDMATCETTSSDNTNNGSSNVQSYSCSSWDASGPEIVYAFSSIESSNVTASLASIEAGQDLDLYILEDSGNGVDPSACLTFGDTEATWTSSAGGDYFIVVDGYNGAAGSFNLELTCPTGPAPEPPVSTEPFVDRTHCLDWNSASFTSPSGVMGLLSGIGINLADYSLLLSTTAADTSAGTIDMLGGSAQVGNCSQDLSAPTYDLTPTPGSLTGNHFSVGPVDMTMNLGASTLNVYDVVLSGDFSADGMTITNGTFDAELDIDPLNLPWGACLVVLDCHSCPGGQGNCITFSGEQVVFNDNGLGPLTPVP
ncbi:MAG: hypothetical protein VX498_15990 [Myxococcota bacterium]|nr:hypothetical protein [Myxococcota bacterium]